MLALLFARPIDPSRRYLAAFLFEAARVTLFGAIHAFDRGLVTSRLLHVATRTSSVLNRSAFFVAFGKRVRRHRKSRL
jgi:hypothetical protein